MAEPHSLGDVIATLMTQHCVGYFTPMLRQGKGHLLDLLWGSRSTFGPTYLKTCKKIAYLTHDQKIQINTVSKKLLPPEWQQCPTVGEEGKEGSWDAGAMIEN